MITRSIVLFCPDWSLISAYRDESLTGLKPGIPLGLVSKGVIKECSNSASKAGIHRGMRSRDAQTRCPDLILVNFDGYRDRKYFDTVLSNFAKYVSELSVLSPGLVAFKARGLSRFYGSEENASRLLLGAMKEKEPLAEGCVGIADDLFTAVTAAKNITKKDQIKNVKSGEEKHFLAEMPLEVLGDPETVALLQRLGLQRLEDFVLLGESAVRGRLGAPGEYLLRLAEGKSNTPLSFQGISEEKSECIHLPESCVLVEQVAFNIKARTESYEKRLRRAGLVITKILIWIGFDDRTEQKKIWSHPQFFTSPDLVDRVRWQLEQHVREIDAAESQSSPAVTWISFEALDPEDVLSHEPGLWESKSDSRVHHMFSRIQRFVGAEGVLTGSTVKGRSAKDTQQMTPWGNRKTLNFPGPLPGALPSPLPGTVFTHPQKVSLLGKDGNQVKISLRSELSSQPALIIHGSHSLKIKSWAGPWSIWEKWWRPNESRFMHRLQVVDTQGMGWLISSDGSAWSLDARYD